MYRAGGLPFFILERPVRLTLPVCSPVFHILISVYPHNRNKKKVSVPLSKPTLPVAHKTFFFTDSDATRHDPSVNDAPSPAIRTNAYTMPPHLTRPSSSPGPKPAEPWLGEPRCQAILSSHVQSPLIPARVHHFLACSLLTPPQHRPRPIVSRMEAKTYLWLSLRDVCSLPLPTLSLTYNHFKNILITIDPAKRITTNSTTPVITKTRPKSYQNHPSFSAQRRWSRLHLCSSQLSLTPPPPSRFLIITRRMHT